MRWTKTFARRRKLITKSCFTCARRRLSHQCRLHTGHSSRNTGLNAALGARCGSPNHNELSEEICADLEDELHSEALHPGARYPQTRGSTQLPRRYLTAVSTSQALTRKYSRPNMPMISYRTANRPPGEVLCVTREFRHYRSGLRSRTTIS